MPYLQAGYPPFHLRGFDKRMARLQHRLIGMLIFFDLMRMVQDGSAGVTILCKFCAHQCQVKGCLCIYNVLNSSDARVN